MNDKIDAYIGNNPKEWNRLLSMPTEQMARVIILQSIRTQERKDRIRAAVRQKLNESPALKRELQALIARKPTLHVEAAQTLRPKLSP